MKRIATVVTLAASMAIAGAGSALAANNDYPPSPNGTGGGTGGGGGVAFTGADITLGMVLVGALVVAGVVALFLSRRRARA